MAQRLQLGYKPPLRCSIGCLPVQASPRALAGDNHGVKLGPVICKQLFTYSPDTTWIGKSGWCRFFLADPDRKTEVL